MMQTLTDDETRQLAFLERSAVRMRDEQELQRRIVAELRETGIPWQTIAKTLGITKQGAQQRFKA